MNIGTTAAQRASRGDLTKVPASGYCARRARRAVAPLLHRHVRHIASLRDVLIAFTERTRVSGADSNQESLLPLRRAASRLMRETSRTRRILVVDDDMTALETFCGILGAAGFSPVAAASVPDALIVVEEQLFDLALVRPSLG